MNHWMTVHWPPHEGRPADEVAGGLWVPDGREQAAVEVRAGDLVLIYHPQTGRTMVEALPDGSVRHHRCQRGREGLVGIARARGPVAARSDVQPERYSDGSSIWWRWHAELELLTTAGFVPRPRVCAALGFKGSYNFRGFGDAHSGLKRITPAVFERLLAEFRASSPNRLPAPQPGPTGRFGGGEESTAHRALKEYVAANCERVFGEVGLAHRHTEYDFPTGDRADVVLEDRYGRVVGVEIEVDVAPGDLVGTLQAVKYRWMLEVLRGARHAESRAALVAYTIHPDVRRTSERYGVQCIEVPQREVPAKPSGASGT